MFDLAFPGSGLPTARGDGFTIQHQGVVNRAQGGFEILPVHQKGHGVGPGSGGEAAHLDTSPGERLQRPTGHPRMEGDVVADQGDDAPADQVPRTMAPLASLHDRRARRPGSRHPRRRDSTMRASSRSHATPGPNRNTARLRMPISATTRPVAPIRAPISVPRRSGARVLRTWIGMPRSASGRTVCGWRTLAPKKESSAASS